MSVLFSIVFASWLAGCPSSGQDPKAKGGPKGGGRSSGPVSVATITVSERSVADEVKVVIPLFGREQTEVFSRVQGRVAAIEKQEGEKVQTKEVLFRIDRTEPGESFLSVPVTSPIGGWMGRVLVTRGQQIGTQDPLAIVVADDVLRGEISLPQDAFAKVRRDTPVSLLFNGDIIPGRIVSIARSAAADAGRGSFTIEVENRDHRLRAGTIVTATVALGTRPRIVIPAGAMRITDQGAYVFVADQEKAKRVAIDFSLLNASEIEVQKGVDPGMKLIVSGANQLSDGGAIKIVSVDGTPATPNTPSGTSGPKP
jgi:multidrug efflux pump subunit AcrA (membrane-fusion protein)